MEENIPVKRHPLYKGESTLDQVDGLSALFEDEFANLGELTIEQKSDKFMSDYIANVNPVGRFKDYFESSAKTTNHILKEIKNFHKRLVLDGSWGEEKYISVINDIFENKVVFNVATIDRGGLMYDKSSETSQSGERTVRLKRKENNNTSSTKSMRQQRKPRIVSMKNRNNEPPF